jgi:hypothetical protein
VTKPGNTKRTKQRNHVAATKLGGESRRPMRGYATPEEQMRELFNHLVARDRRVAESLLTIVQHLANAQAPGLVVALATVVDFAVKQTMHPRAVRR